MMPRWRRCRLHPDTPGARHDLKSFELADLLHRPSREDRPAASGSHLCFAAVYGVVPDPGERARHLGAARLLAGWGLQRIDSTCAHTAIMPTNKLIDAIATASSTTARIILDASPKERKKNIVLCLFQVNWNLSMISRSAIEGACLDVVARWTCCRSAPSPKICDSGQFFRERFCRLFFLQAGT
jgi:hypothetical protein